MPSLEIVVALAENHVIGANGQIPWHLSEDLKHFKAVTMGHPVLMGRRTFESIGRVLPGRRNIMVSSTFDKQVEGLEVVKSIEEAKALVGPADKLMIIGGARMYAQALAEADVLHLTRIKATVDGDTLFPQWSTEIFKRDSVEDFYSEKCGFAYSFETWTRR